MLDGTQMISWMKDLWSYPRSITGYGTRKTLEYLQNINKDLNIFSFKSGTKVFDWEIPEEWNVYDTFIEHESGKRFAELSKNNLHVLGYSMPCDKYISLSELLPHIYTQPDQPDVIPYVTSYYYDRWGICMSEKEKQKLPDGEYRVVINTEKAPGTMEIADLIIKGQSTEEIFFSTNVCHPSMANNELSGPVLSSALIKYIKSEYPNSRLSYRFVFVPETIGSIAYLSKNLKDLKDNVICGFNLSCVGDERAFSHIESRMGDCLADTALRTALINLTNVTTYSFLSRGSDERQYCAPGIDLPVCGFSRSKYGSYPEYHTSADNFDVVTAKGLNDSFDVMKSIIDAFEMNSLPKITVKCEPQLGKRNLYPTISQKGDQPNINTRMDFMAYADGKHSLFDISIKIGKNIKDVTAEAAILGKHGLISFNTPKNNS